MVLIDENMLLSRLQLTLLFSVRVSRATESQTWSANDNTSLSIRRIIRKQCSD